MAPRAPSRDASDRPSVALLEPDLDNRLILSALLRYAGYDVLQVARPEDVRALVRAHAVGLVVTELYVPCGDYPCAVAAVRRDPAGATVPILAFTARVFPADLRWAAEAGASAVLTKPAAARDILDAVGALLPRAA